MYTFQLLSQFVPPSPSPAVSKICSLCLHLYPCPANLACFWKRSFFSYLRRDETQPHTPTFRGITQDFAFGCVFYSMIEVSRSCSVAFDSLPPHGLYSPWNSPGQNTGVGSLYPSPGDLPNPGIEPRPPTSQADSLPAEPQGKPKNPDPDVKPRSPALQADSLPIELWGKPDFIPQWDIFWPL